MSSQNYLKYFLKRKAIKTNEVSDWNKYRSSRYAGHTTMRQAEREYHSKIQIKNNPKYALKTINTVSSSILVQSSGLECNVVI